MMPDAGKFIVQFLENSGIDRVYCVPGESFLPVLDALVDSKIETLTTRHESAAGFMAVADGRLTGRPGVAMVSRGPGVTNASIAVHTAQQDGLPMLLFVGQVERRNLRRDGFQEIDYGKMFADIAKLTVEVRDPDDLPQILSRAFFTAVSGTPGPVVIALPEDLLALPVTTAEAVPSDMPLYTLPASGPSLSAVSQAAQLLSRASRPLIIAGMEFAREGGRELLLRFAEKFSVPVAVSFRRHDLFPNLHPLYAGDLGIANPPAQLDLFGSADLVLALGTRLGDLTTHGYTFPLSPWPRQPLVHVYDDASLVGRHFNPVVGAVCKAPDFLAMLLREDCGPADGARADWARSLHEQTSRQNAWTQSRQPDGVVFRNVVHELSSQLGPDTSIVPDAGISAALVYRFFPFSGAQRLYATMAGVMGFGIPGAIAVAMREPRRTVVCLVGDGGFMMTGNDLAIAVEKKLPVRVFLANNRNLGTIHFHQEKLYPGRSHASALPGPDFTRLVRAFGCTALTLDSEEDIARVVAEALAVPGPVVVDVRTSLRALTAPAGT